MKKIELETCLNCGAKIGQLETPHLWKEQIVCGQCWKRLCENQNGQIPSSEFRQPPNYGWLKWYALITSTLGWIALLGGLGSGLYGIYCIFIANSNFEGLFFSAVGLLGVLAGIISLASSQSIEARRDTARNTFNLQK